MCLKTKIYLQSFEKVPMGVYAEGPKLRPKHNNGTEKVHVPPPVGVDHHRHASQPRSLGAPWVEEPQQNRSFPSSSDLAMLMRLATSALWAAMLFRCVLCFDEAAEEESCKGLVAGKDDDAGEKACEGRNLNKKQCMALGCCVWDDGKCFFCGDLEHDPGCGGDGVGYKMDAEGTYVLDSVPNGADPGCPGGSLLACMALCPSSPASAFHACVKECARRCSLPTPPSPKPPAPTPPSPPLPPAPRHRPRAHFLPGIRDDGSCGWMNDPNGMLEKVPLGPQWVGTISGHSEGSRLLPATPRGGL